MSISTRSFDYYWFLIALLGVYLIEIGKNAVNECVDYLTGVDPGVDSVHRTDFSGSKKTIVDGLLTVDLFRHLYSQLPFNSRYFHFYSKSNLANRHSYYT